MAENTGAEDNGPAVLIERIDHILIATINRPKARNAVNVDVHVALGSALAEADRDPEIRVVIVTGAGTQAFCAGADLKALARGDKLEPADEVQRAWGFAGFVSHEISKPIIAAVNGFALGGGTELVLASDLVIASDTASFGLPEVKRGLMAAAGGAFRLSRQLPAKIAMQYLLTGEAMTAQVAASLGLVNAVVPQDQVLDTAIAMARVIAANAPLAVQASKRLAKGVQDGIIAGERDNWALNRREQRLVFSSEDATEGMKAFGEKREPVWTAR